MSSFLKKWSGHPNNGCMYVNVYVEKIQRAKCIFGICICTHVERCYIYVFNFHSFCWSFFVPRNNLDATCWEENVCVNGFFLFFHIRHKHNILIFVFCIDDKTNKTDYFRFFFITIPPLLEWLMFIKNNLFSIFL